MKPLLSQLKILIKEPNGGLLHKIKQIGIETEAKAVYTVLYLAAIPIIFLALWGLVDVIRQVGRAFFDQRAKRIEIIVLPLTGHVENLEQIVRSVLSEQAWSDKTQDTEIILLDNGLDEETKALCKMLCSEGTVIFCSPYSVDSVLAERISFAK
ncbi:MAG: hypothetical protein ACOX6U_02535 [Oscillospiraceae bacterium]